MSSGNAIAMKIALEAITNTDVENRFAHDDCFLSLACGNG